MEKLTETAIDIINDLCTQRLNYYTEYIPLIDAAIQLSNYEDLELTPREIELLKAKWESCKLVLTKYDKTELLEEIYQLTEGLI